MNTSWNCLGLILTVAVCIGRANAADEPVRIAAQHLPNACRLHPNVISGGLPEGDAAFRELRDWGVKTVISVDGAQPNVTLAKKYGLRYVHLPHGYDGISPERTRQLAKAVRDLPGPIYIHCHHGQHRSPAAATVACVATGLLRPDQARQVLTAAGTSENYRGLFQAAEAARRIDDRLLDESPAEFPEAVRLPAMAESMVLIERAHDHLVAMGKNGWRPTRQHPDLSAGHEALLLREQFTELLRTPELRARPEAFRELVRASESAAKELETALENAGQVERAERALTAVSKSCTACHREFRDRPR